MSRRHTDISKHHLALVEICLLARLQLPFHSTQATRDRSDDIFAGLQI